MEIDPKLGMNELPDDFFPSEDPLRGSLRSMTCDLLPAFSAVDEAVSYAVVK